MNEDVLVLTRGLAIRLLAVNGFAAIVIWLVVRWLAKRLDRRTATRAIAEKDEKFSHQ